MKKFKLATLFLLGASFFALPLMAQKPSEGSKTCVENGYCKDGKTNCDKEKPQCAKGVCGKTNCNKTDCTNPDCKNPQCKGFKEQKGRKGDKGLNANRYGSLKLSDAQRSQLQALDMRRDSVRRAARQEMNRQGREMKQRNDSAFRAARQAESRNYLEEVKAIVGPDQYVVFLEDFYVNSPAQGRGKAFNKEARNGKEMKAAKVGDRGRKAYKDSKGKIARADKDARGRFAKEGKIAKDKAVKGVKDAKKAAKSELK